MNKSIRYTIVVMFASVLLLGVATFWYANYTADRSTQRFCDVVGVLDQGFRQAPPSAPTGRVLANKVHLLYHHLHCPPLSQGGSQ